MSCTDIHQISYLFIIKCLLVTMHRVTHEFSKKPQPDTLHPGDLFVCIWHSNNDIMHRLKISLSDVSFKRDEIYIKKWICGWVRIWNEIQPCLVCESSFFRKLVQDSLSSSSKVMIQTLASSNSKFKRLRRGVLLKSCDSSCFWCLQ